MTDHVGNAAGQPAEQPEPSAAARANVFPWPPVLFVSLLIASWLMGSAIPVAWPGTNDGPARAIGIGFGVSGLALAIWSIVTLSRAGTTVMPHGQSSALVTAGPYARFRNPIYLGEVLMLLGLAEMTKNIWFVAAAVMFAVLVTVLQILPEERHLAARFGKAYDAYKQKTRRWI